MASGAVGFAASGARVGDFGCCGMLCELHLHTPKILTATSPSVSAVWVTFSSPPCFMGNQADLKKSSFRLKPLRA